VWRGECDEKVRWHLIEKLVRQVYPKRDIYFWQTREDVSDDLDVS
jgi:hypothetical protein